MKIQLSKLDVAKRQIETAITLYFHNGDPVSIHTLTQAAYHVIRDVLKAQGKESMFKDFALQYIKEDKREEFGKLLNKHQNFFKHANKDPNSIIEFDPETAEPFLWEICNSCRNMRDEENQLMACFDSWFKLNRPHIFTGLNTEPYIQLRSNYLALGRNLFYKDFFGL